MKIFRFLGKGVGHEDAGKGCQDRLSTFITENGRYIYAISDGCSSSKYAEETAQCNIDVINKVFSRINANNLSRDSFIEVYPELAEHLANYDVNDISSCFAMIFRYELSCLAKKYSPTNAKMSDYCATLLFVVVENDYTMVGHVGDGNIIFYDKEGKVVYRSAEENGEDSRHTYFTINENFPDHFYFDTIPTDSYHSLIMFSDGPQTMFKLELGAIDKGAYDLVIKPITDKQVETEEDLTKNLQKSLLNAMHYGFDDWSIIVATKQIEKSLDIIPISLKQLFMEAYNNELEAADNGDVKSDENNNSSKNSVSDSQDIDTSDNKSDEQKTENPKESDCQNSDDKYSYGSMHKKIIKKFKVIKIKFD